MEKGMEKSKPELIIGYLEGVDGVNAWRQGNR